MRKQGILLGLLVCLILGGCAARQPEQEIELLEPVGVVLDSAVAYIGDLSEIVCYESAVVPAVEELSMTIDGRVAKINATIGDEVRAGDVLLELDESDTQQAYDALKKDIAYSQTMNDYNNRLAELDIELLKNDLQMLEEQEEPDAGQIALKKKDIELAELTLRQDREKQALSLQYQYQTLQKLSDGLGKNLLTAPFDGRIASAVSIREGDQLEAYRTAVYLADESRLSLSGESISKSEIRNASRIYALIEGREYEILYQEMDRKEYISLVLSGCSIPAEFTFADGDRPAGVEAGQFAVICLERKTRDQVLLIPTNAVMGNDGDRYVYVIGENGERSYRSIQTGTSTAWLTEVTAGLEEGETVYVKD